MLGGAFFARAPFLPTFCRLLPRALVALVAASADNACAPQAVGCESCEIVEAHALESESSSPRLGGGLTVTLRLDGRELDVLSVKSTVTVVALVTMLLFALIALFALVVLFALIVTLVHVLVPELAVEGMHAAGIAFACVCIGERIAPPSDGIS